MSSLLQLLLFIYLSSYSIVFSDETFNGPSSPNDWSTWINQIKAQRTKDLNSIRYNGSIMEVAGIDWTKSTFIQPQMHGYDQYFYDGVTSHSYTLDRWLTDLKDRYGGIDSFLFWVTYTNIGADDRNQFDLNYAIPGGLDAMKSFINYMHKQDPPIYVLFPYNPWDQGTRYLGKPDYQYMAQFLSETGGDGFNGDTMGSVPEDFYTYSRDHYNHPIAIEPEGGGSLQSMNWDTLGWGYWPVDSTYRPVVGQWKWNDGRHMTNICDRWDQNHTNDIQNAYFNGVGFESWENVWGSWNGIVPRDGEAIRRMATILRYFGNRKRDPTKQNFTQSQDWLPYIPIISDTKNWNNLFASAFPVNSGKSNQQILFLIVNRNSRDVNNAQISFENSFTINTANLHVFDCYHGIELKFTVNAKNIDTTINVVEGLGYGCLLATMDTRTSNKDLDSFLSTMNSMTQKPLNSFSSTWHYLMQNMTKIPKTKLYSTPPDANMVSIPRGIYHFINTGVEIEGGDWGGVDVQYKWETAPRKDHDQIMTIDKFYMDKFPVTCSEYSKYLTSSGYVPKDTYNYLKNWNYDNVTNKWTFPKGYDNKPVTYLSLNEARLFCAANGKRIPHSYEWQYSGQGNTSMIYPWGNSQHMGSNFPQTQHGRTIPGPSDVDTYSPKSDSLFGVADLIGNVWQYTDEFSDIHTRAVVVMGSANYRPSGSMWYFPVAYQLNQHNKYFLMDDSYDRCGTIGFRCAADAVQPTDANDIYGWNGVGTYCPDLVGGGGVFCGMINPQNGYNDLTAEGTLDWIQFGMNSKDNSGYYEIRKKGSMEYISKVNDGSGISTYGDNPTAFYWSDGGNDIPVLPLSEATHDGIYLSDSTISFNIDNLKGGTGNIYVLKVYVGVYKNSGTLHATLTVGSKTYEFIDNTIYDGGGTTNVVYDFVINLESISSTEAIQCVINWIANRGDGNVTLQAIALALAAKD